WGSPCGPSIERPRGRCVQRTLRGQTSGAGAGGGVALLALRARRASSSDRTPKLSRSGLSKPRLPRATAARRRTDLRVSADSLRLWTTASCCLPLMARTLSCAERRASTFCLRSASGASIQGMPGRASWAFWTTLCHLSTLSENELLLMTTSSEKEDRRNGDPRHSNLCESVTSARFHPPRPARVQGRGRWCSAAGHRCSGARHRCSAPDHR